MALVISYSTWKPIDNKSLNCGSLTYIGFLQYSLLSSFTEKVNVLNTR